MNDYEQTIKRLIETTPAWEKDGGGIRGRTIAPLIGGASTSGMGQEFEAQQFRNNKNQFSLRGPTTSDDLFLSAPSNGGDPLPWDIIIQEQNASSSILRVQAGTLNGILPSNWNATFSVGNTGLYYAKANITTDGENITGVSIQINGTQPSQQQPKKFSIETNIDYLFGLFNNGVASRVIGPQQITVSPVRWLVVSASPPAEAGESPYDIYYRLQ